MICIITFAYKLSDCSLITLEDKYLSLSVSEIYNPVMVFPLKSSLNTILYTTDLNKLKDSIDFVYSLLYKSENTFNLKHYNEGRETLCLLLSDFYWLRKNASSNQLVLSIISQCIAGYGGCVI